MSIRDYDVFPTSARTKKLKDDKEKGGENEITDLFLATTGCKATMKLTTMSYPTNLEHLTFEKNKLDHKKKYEVHGKVGRGRKNEVHVDEKKKKIDKPIIKYLHRLRNASRYCEFKKLEQE